MQQELRRGRPIRILLLIGFLVLALISLKFAFAHWSQSTNGQTRARRTSSGSEIILKRGGDLQSAINSAEPGDTIVLEAGATYTGTILLPEKKGNAYITIRSSELSRLPEGQRVSPAQASLMPKIVSPGKGSPALQTARAAHHYRLIGLEIMPADEKSFAYTLIWLGLGDKQQTTLDSVPHHLTIDRCYIHAWPNQSLKRGIDLNSAETEITNSYISDFKSTDQDAQTIVGWNGPGPFKIINNYLEASGENLMFGGSDPQIPNLIPSDIEIRRNHFRKPLSWRGVWMCKNILELKLGRRVTIEGNVFENSWASGQEGYAIMFTVRNQEGTAPWSVVEDVLFANNIVRHAASGVMILGSDNLFPSAQSSRITIRNNLFEDIDTKWNPSATARFLVIFNINNLTVSHNTVIGPTTIAYINPVVNKSIAITDNIIAHYNGGIIGEGIGAPDSYRQYAVPHTITGNLFVGALQQFWNADTKYPAGNRYPNSYDDVGFMNYNGGQGGDYRLKPGSPYKGKASDGKDPGADMSAIEAAVTGVVAGGQP
ncbi:MAG: hypothetical protein C5B44_01595 [Acidobacteria bacterium]|nr:MAG: hypothetical protein C5B44_01595 [Acidobacteriota bacterium]